MPPDRNCADDRIRAVLVAVGNGSSYGGGMRICPYARVEDGLLDVTVMGPVRRGHLLLPAVCTVRLSTPDITSYVDGEALVPLPITAECVGRAVLVLAPPG